MDNLTVTDVPFMVAENMARNLIAPPVGDENKIARALFDITRAAGGYGGLALGHAQNHGITLPHPTIKAVYDEAEKKIYHADIIWGDNIIGMRRYFDDLCVYKPFPKTLIMNPHCKPDKAFWKWMAHTIKEAIDESEYVEPNLTVVAPNKSAPTDTKTKIDKAIKESKKPPPSLTVV